jgi:hypothetical protein
MGLSRQLHTNRVVRPDDSIRQDYSHHPRRPHDLAVTVSKAEQAHQALLKVLDLPTRVSEPGQLDGRISTQVQDRTGGQGEKIDSPGCHVLTEFPWRYLVPPVTEGIE